MIGQTHLRIKFQIKMINLVVVIFLIADYVTTFDLKFANCRIPNNNPDKGCYECYFPYIQVNGYCEIQYNSIIENCELAFFNMELL